MKDDPGYNFALNLTKKKEYYSQSLPYINADGELCVLGWVGSLAGAGKYLEIVNITTKESEETIYYQSKTQEVYTFDIGEVPAKPEDKAGDVNGDGKINALDATQILRYANNKPSAVKNLVVAGKSVLADVNNDGRINALDATQILRFANNKPSSITE